MYQINYLSPSLTEDLFLSPALEFKLKFHVYTGEDKKETKGKLSIAAGFYISESANIFIGKRRDFAGITKFKTLLGLKNFLLYQYYPQTYSINFSIQINSLMTATRNHHTFWQLLC